MLALQQVEVPAASSDPVQTEFESAKCSLFLVVTPAAIRPDILESHRHDLKARSTA